MVENREQELRQAIKDHIQNSDESQSAVAKAIGISPAALSQFLGGTYATPHKLLPKLEAFLSVKEKRLLAPVAPGFIMTGISKAVIEIITYCHIQGKMGTVYGDAGIGKTQGIQEYVKEYPETVLVTASPAFSSQKGMYRVIARELRIAEAGTKDDLFMEIVDKLKDSGRVIVIDEAQHLPHMTLEGVRSIHDFAKVGIVFVGNHEIHSKMMGRGEAAFAQLFSRLAIKKKVMTVDVSFSDIQLLFPDLSKEEQTYLWQVSKSRWGIRGAVNVFVNSAANQNISVQGMMGIAKQMGIGA